MSFNFTLSARNVIEQKQLSSQTTLSSFQKPDFSVPRQHEDFIWLHDTLVETEEYAGLIVSRNETHLDAFFFFLLANFVFSLFFFSILHLIRSPQPHPNLTLRAPGRKCTNWGKVKPRWRRRSTPRWSRNWRREFSPCVSCTPSSTCLFDIDCPLFHFPFFQWISSRVQKDRPGPWSLPAKTVVSPYSEQGQKLSHFLGIRPGRECVIMQSQLSGQERKQGNGEDMWSMAYILLRSALTPFLAPFSVKAYTCQLGAALAALTHNSITHNSTANVIHAVCVKIYNVTWPWLPVIRAMIQS